MRSATLDESRGLEMVNRYFIDVELELEKLAALDAAWTLREKATLDFLEATVG